MKWKGKSVQISCKFSNERMCTRKKDVEKLSCGFEGKNTKSAVRVVLYMLFSDYTASAIQSDSVRHPIRFRPPPDQIASAVRLDSVRHPIGFRSPSDQIPFAVQSYSVRSTMTSAALFLDKHLQSLAQCYNFVRRNTNNNIINNLNEKHNYEYQVRNSRHQECQGRG